MYNVYSHNYCTTTGKVIKTCSLFADQRNVFIHARSRPRHWNSGPSWMFSRVFIVARVCLHTTSTLALIADLWTGATFNLVQHSTGCDIRLGATFDWVQHLTGCNIRLGATFDWVQHLTGCNIRLGATFHCLSDQNSRSVYAIKAGIIIISANYQRLFTSY